MSCIKALGHAVLILPESLWHCYSILQVTMPTVATIHSVLTVGQHPGTELSCGMGPALQEKYLCIMSIYFPRCNKIPSKSSFSSQSVTAGQAWWQELVTTGHIAPTVRKWKDVDDCAQLSSSFSQGPKPTECCYPHLHGSPLLSELI